MKKLRRMLFSSIIACLLCFITLGTSTYAWFSMNQKVSVTGMAVTTAVNDNLFIVQSSAGNDKAADSTFRNALHYDTAAIQLQPVSSVDASSFFYTNDAAADGHSISGAYTALPADNTITVNSTNYKGYADYVFELKAINANGADEYVNLTKLNILYEGAAEKVTHAFRVAIFAQASTDEFNALTDEQKAPTYTGAYSAIANVKSIFAKSDYAYFNGTNAVNSVNNRAAVSNLNSAVSLQVPANQTRYFKITVRIWLEGEDTDCYNTKFVNLTSAWALDLAFELQNASSSVSALDATANASLTLNESTLTAALSVTGESAATYAFYKVGEAQAVQAASATATCTASTAGTYYCVITTVKGNVYTTPYVIKNN